MTNHRISAILACAATCICAPCVIAHHSHGSTTHGLPPMVYQKDGNDCGVAALATLMRDDGMVVSLEDLRKFVFLSDRGASMTSLRQLAARRGLQLRGVYVGSRRPASLSPPWIAFWPSAVGGHYVVVEQVDSTVVAISDPALGRRRMDLTDFARRWSGYALAH